MKLINFDGKKLVSLENVKSVSLNQISPRSEYLTIYIYYRDGQYETSPNSYTKEEAGQWLTKIEKILTAE